MILAIDQGTTGTTCLVVDEELRVRGRAYRELPQHFPQAGWVEHEPHEIWESVLAASAEALSAAGIRAAQLDAIGVTNQRETTVVWDRGTGEPVHRAIVWQDRRTAERCRALPAELVRSRTGLVPDPYFSATKLEWILRRVGKQQRSLAFGTVDSWLVWKLTEGRVHATDVTNASRTMLFDLRTLEWDDELLEVFGIDRAVLPHVVASSGVLGEGALHGASVPVAGLAGDQQASLFGHGCVEQGMAKATYGTGSFVLVNVGEAAEPPPHGLLLTTAAVAPGRPQQYVLEGAVLVAGAAIQWLRDGLGIVGDAHEAEELARQVDSTDGVHFVPALTGLGSPWWDADARGVICGITRGTTRAHLARAALEAIAFQVADVLAAYPHEIATLRADGGAASNRLLMQLQADVAGCEVEVAADAETTALGAAALAGLAVGTWHGVEEIAPLLRTGARYEPRISRDEAASRTEAWRRALERTFSHPPS